MFSSRCFQAARRRDSLGDLHGIRNGTETPRARLSIPTAAPVLLDSDRNLTVA